MAGTGLPGDHLLQGPRGRVSAQPGTSGACLSHVVGVCACLCPISWTGLGPALQRAALLDGVLRPGSELIVLQAQLLSTTMLCCAVLCCSILYAHKESNKDVTVPLKCQRGFRSKNSFRDTYTKDTTGNRFFFFNIYIYFIKITNFNRRRRRRRAGSCCKLALGERTRESQGTSGALEGKSSGHEPSQKGPEEL